ncbi:MAG: DUF3592 domain-containing protein [Steroidobacteraceae bacterium]|nr:DUF3592 domain-containing protein [Steroidobacteraceae bacterium]
MKKPGVLSVLFGLIGLGLLAGAIALALNTRSFIATAKHAPGIVTELIEKRDTDDGSITYKPVVAFTADSGASVTFASSFSSNPPAYDVGETVDVLYAPDNPNEARIRGFGSLWLGAVILGGIGTVFTGIGFGILVASRLNKKKRDWLMAYGTEIQAEFQSVERNTSLKVNGRSPWRIIAQWQNPETGQLHVFHSENVWFDPTKHVTSKQLKVLLDPKNSKRYHVDVSFLPQLAPGS